MDLPKYLIKFGKLSSDHQNWVESLPKLVSRIKDKWDLEIGKPYVDNVSCFLCPKLLN